MAFYPGHHALDDHIPFGAVLVVSTYVKGKFPLDKAYCDLSLFVKEFLGSRSLQG